MISSNFKERDKPMFSLDKSKILAIAKISSSSPESAYSWRVHKCIYSIRTATLNKRKFKSVCNIFR